MLGSAMHELLGCSTLHGKNPQDDRDSFVLSRPK